MKDEKQPVAPHFLNLKTNLHPSINRTTFVKPLNQIDHSHPTNQSTMKSPPQQAPTPTPPNNQRPPPKLIYVLGAPGAGKGTLCTLLANHYTDIHHLSIGDHLRTLLAPEITNTTPQTWGCLDHSTFSSLMQDRKLLPADAIVAIISDAVRTIVDAAPFATQQATILLDGFPRSPDAAELALASWGEPTAVLFFDCPRMLAEVRFLQRRRSADDSVEVFRARYDEFAELNKELLAKYGDSVVQIGTETETDETWKRLQSRWSELLDELEAMESISIENQVFRRTVNWP